MNSHRRLLSGIALTSALLFACGSSDGGNDNGNGGNGGNGGGGSAIGSGENRGGPDSLEGFTWTSPPITVDGVELQGSFRFDKTSVTASNTCGGGQDHAEVTSPVRYHYTMDVLEDAESRTGDDDNNCGVSISKAKVALEVVSGKLRMTTDGEAIDFQPGAGAHSGLYGEWTADSDFGKLKWSIKNGALTATAECTNGLSATTQAKAAFVNLFDIPETVNSADQGGGGRCTASIIKGTYTYRFDGDALLIGDAQGKNEIRFDK